MEGGIIRTESMPSTIYFIYFEFIKEASNNAGFRAILLIKLVFQFQLMINIAVAVLLELSLRLEQASLMRILGHNQPLFLEEHS